MRLARCLLISGSAAVMVGSLVLGGEAAVTSMAAPARARPAPGRPPPSWPRRAPPWSATCARRTRRSRRSGRAGRTTGRRARSPRPAPRRPPALQLVRLRRRVRHRRYLHEVSGQWRTPAVLCTRRGPDRLALGRPGRIRQHTVEQDGTVSWCFEGTPTYFTWYEMSPAGTVEVGKALRPGDEITAKVARSGNKYTLSLTDATDPANGFSMTQNCALGARTPAPSGSPSGRPSRSASRRWPATRPGSCGTRPRRPTASPERSPALAATTRSP